MFNFLKNLFKPKKHYTKTTTCPVCLKVVVKKSNTVTCGKKKCKLALARKRYADKKSLREMPIQEVVIMGDYINGKHINPAGEGITVPPAVVPSVCYTTATSGVLPGQISFKEIANQADVKSHSPNL